MKKSFFFSISNIVLGSFILIQLTACATMNESECRVADWEMIGLEDGSKGRQTSYIGQHRKACSGYQITPDLDAYLRGHAQGLRQFCTEANGYAQGVRGYENNQLCTANWAKGFNKGYRDGFKVFKVKSDIYQVSDQINSLRNRLESNSQLIRTKEEQIINNATSPQRKRELLDQIKDLTAESEAIYREIEHLEIQLARLESQYQRLINRRS